MQHILLAVLAAVSCSLDAPATVLKRSEERPPLSLAKALELAGASEPNLEAAQAEVRAANAARVAARIHPNPTIGVDVENVTGLDLNNAEITASLSLPIELGGKRAARIAAANADEARARIGIAVARADLQLAVTLGFIEAVAADERVSAAQELLNSLDREARHEHSNQISPLERQRQKSIRIDAVTSLKRTQRLAELARSSLSRRIGRSFEGPLNSNWFPVIGTSGPQIQTNPARLLEVAAAQADLDAAGASARLAQSETISDLVVSLGVRRFTRTAETAALFGVSIPLPLFGGRGAATSQVRANQDRIEARLRALELNIEDSIAEADAELANAAEAAQAANGPMVATAAETLRISRFDHCQGKLSQIDLLEAAAALAEARKVAIDALAAYHSTKARRARLTQQISHARSRRDDQSLRQ